MKFYDKDQIMYDSDEMGYINFADKFIHEYEPLYFIGSDPEKGASGRAVAQSSHPAEEEIQIYLDKGIAHSEDIMKILEWKIGRIDHKASEDRGVVCYRDTPLDEFIVKSYGNKIRAEKLCKYIASEYSSLSVQTPKEIYDNLLNLKVQGLGTVYLLTLVYFISKGKSPIYDRFAHQALDALEKGLEPRKDGVQRPAPPDKNNKKVFEWFEGQYGYGNRLKTMFPDHYKKRELDRALWVYGHLFKS